MTTTGITKTTDIDAARVILNVAERRVSQGWTKEHFAVDADGQPVTPLDERACAWCLWGACLVAQEELGASEDAMNLARKAIVLICSARRGTRDYPFIGPTAYNDDPRVTQAHVISALRDAAEVVHLAPLVRGVTYSAGWARKLLEKDRLQR